MNRTPIHDKVVASVLGTAVSQVLIYCIESIPEPNIDLPFSVEGAIALILTFALGYFVPETKPPTA